MLSRTPAAASPFPSSAALPAARWRPVAGRGPRRADRPRSRSGRRRPAIGQGLSTAARDVRLACECLADNGAWSMAALQPHVAERKERMRRPRFTGRLVAALREFSDDARARRLLAYERMAADPGAGLGTAAGVEGDVRPFATESIRPLHTPELECSRFAPEIRR